MKKIVLLLAFLIIASPVFADRNELSDKVKPDKNSAKIQTPTDKELQKLLDKKAKYELMRTKHSIEATISKIATSYKSASDKNLANANAVIKSSRGVDY